MAPRGTLLCALVAAVIAAACASVVGAAASDEPPDRVYRWTDAAGEPHFTNNIMNVPEPHRSRYLGEEAQERARVKAKQGPPPKFKKYDYTDISTNTRKPFKDYLPADTRHEEAAAKAREEAIKAAKEGLDGLKALLKKKTDEFNLSAGWEMILHTPKHKQDKLRIIDELGRIKAQIKENEKKLEELSKPPPSE